MCCNDKNCKLDLTEVHGCNFCAWLDYPYDEHCKLCETECQFELEDVE